MPLWVNLAIVGYLLPMAAITKKEVFAFMGLGWLIGYGIYLGL